MEKFVEWVAKYFKNNLISLFLFLLGALLLLLGITESISSSPIGPLVPRADYRGVALILGLVFILLSVLFYYRFQNTDDELIVEMGAVDYSDEAVQLLEAKLKKLKNLEANCPFCLVGAVYLDMMVSPIDTKELTNDERSDIEEIRYDTGGSALWVGRFLKMNKGQQSFLFSAIGDANEPHTRHFRDIFLENDNWVLNDNFLEEAQIDGGKIGTTVHLIQRDRNFGTMFTYRGVLRDLSWKRIRTQLERRLEAGGVLYLAGYLKTNLCDGLISALGDLTDRTLICIDHGRLVEETGFGPAIKTLRQAFQARLVDVYFCTYQEIFDLFRVEHRSQPPSNWQQVYKNLINIVERENLPLITMVRGGYINKEMKGFVIVDKKIIPLEGSLEPTFRRGTVGASNAFNASAMYYLVKGEHMKLDDYVKISANKAFRELEEWTKKPDYSKVK